MEENTITAADEPNLPAAVPHKSGFVNIVGNPNVGKSTFINSFAGRACAWWVSA